MFTDFQPVPTFVDGQAISASDINALLYNNAMIDRVTNNPQSLFMMSHAYAPTMLPAIWEDPEYCFWEGSFLYRTGMQYAYLGFWYKLENNSDITSEFALGNLRSPSARINVGVTVKYTDPIYEVINKGTEFYAFADASTAQTTTKNGTTGAGNYGYVTVIREGSGAASSVQTLTNADQTYIVPNSRISTIRIELTGLNLKDGEVVPVKLWFTTYTNTSPDRFTRIRDVISGNPTNLGSLPAWFLRTYFINYDVLYAQTDGDLSYTANWPIGTFQQNLTESNLGLITQKQQYITERLRYKPYPATGSIVYVGAKGGTASLFYPKGDHNLGDPEYTKENYWLPRSATTYEPLYSLSIDLVTPYNTNSCLASFAWNPYFKKYDTLYTNFRFYGIGNTRQTLLVDMAEQPTGMSSFRRVRRADTPGNYQKSYPYIFGDVYTDGGTFGLYDSASALSHAIDNPYVAGNLKTYLNKAFNVRIPSLYTPVFSPEFQQFSNQYTASTNYYLASGLWEDSVAIRFDNYVTDGVYKSWGLFRADNQTIQFGFRSDTNPATINSTFPSAFSVPAGEAFYNYRYLNIYNGDTWRWVTNNGVRGYAPVFINLYDHSNTANVNKTDHTSFIHLLGLTTGSPEYRDYSTPTTYTPQQSLPASGLYSVLLDINNTLNVQYTELFSNNPHFARYDMFWNKPKSPTQYMPLLKKFTDKFFYFTNQRKGNFLVLRGKGVTLFKGEVNTVETTNDIKGSLYPENAVNFRYESSTSVISGDVEETVILNLEELDIPLGSYYYLQGEIVYAAEYFEEPL